MDLLNKVIISSSLKNGFTKKGHSFKLVKKWTPEAWSLFQAH